MSNVTKYTIEIAIKTENGENPVYVPSPQPVTYMDFAISYTSKIITTLNANDCAFILINCFRSSPNCGSDANVMIINIKHTMNIAKNKIRIPSINSSPPKCQIYFTLYDLSNEMSKEFYIFLSK